MFHPNVYPDGRVCLGVLKEKWNAQFDVMLLLHTVRMLLSDPNPNSPANNTVAVIFEKDKKEYERRVRAVVENSWEM
jgi:ubiquitin-protein ligase